MLGYSVDELRRLGPADVGGKEHAMGWPRRKQALLSGASREVTSEKLYMRKDGSTVWVSVVTSLISDDNGKAQHFISVIQDISARRGAELALRESEEKFRQLADNIPEIFWITDARQRKLHYLSPGFETLTGKPLAEVMRRPRSWLQVVHAEDRERVRIARKALPDGEYNVRRRHHTA
jgi:PAS domain S-box-containing protein